LRGAWGKPPPGQMFSPAVREAICAARRPPWRPELRERRDAQCRWGAGAVEGLYPSRGARRSADGVGS